MNAFERGFDELAAGGAARGQIGGELGERRKGHEFSGHGRSGPVRGDANSIKSAPGSALESG
jgi:hypothetical protein